MGRYAVFGAAAIICVLATSVFSQEPIVYPAKGQSQDKMEQDKYQCYSWAKKQTGFDPMQPPPPLAQPRGPRSSPLRGAAGGAALGVVGGAIGGNAGKGAAIGAATGGLIGGLRMRHEQQQITYAQQQQAAAYGQERGGYNRAFSACMEGRGYSVK